MSAEIDAPLIAVMPKGRRVLGWALLVIAFALFIGIDRFYKRAATHPGDFVLLWLCAQYCLATVLLCFFPTTSMRALKEKLLMAVLIGGFMGGATLPKVLATFDVVGGPQLPWWLYRIPCPAISVTACSQAIMVVALEAMIWSVMHVAMFERNSEN